MKPISLKPAEYVNSIPGPYSSFPLVHLDALTDVDLPEEGEIRFRFSRRRKTEVETHDGETVSYELCLKAITDICDCKGKDAENNDPESDKYEDHMDKMMDEMTENDMVDESEDDNPDKY